MSSIGLIQSGKPRYGECHYCWDENWPREHGFCFEARQKMIGPVCRHRLKVPKKTGRQFKENQIHAEMRKRHSEYQSDYWARRALLPDYCGEFGELRCGAGLEGLRKLDSDEAEQRVAASKAKRREL